MKYQANPVIVDAFKIVAVLREGEPNAVLDYVITDDATKRLATGAMTARMAPLVGDYWVIQSDGYEYLNPKDVFERKYSPLTVDPVLADGIEIQSDGTIIGRADRVREFRDFCASRGYLLGRVS